MPQAFASEPAVDDRLLAAYRPLLRQNAQAIRDSWDRCRSAGLGCSDTPRARRVSARRLGALYAANAEVRALALAEMRLLHGHLAARGFTLTLADANSVILDCLPGDTLSAEAAAELSPGHSWPETTHGTNAVGTAAAAGRVVVVAGADHYLESYRSLVCVATPVFGADGEVRAIIDATTDQPLGSHTLAYALGLMQMAGGHVQTELFRRRHGDAWVMLLDGERGAGGLSAIALAFAHDGRLQATSAGARVVFEHRLMAPGTPFEALFVESLSVLAESIRPPVGFVTLTDHHGERFQATIYLPPEQPRVDSDADGASAAAPGAGRRPDAPDHVMDDSGVQGALALADRASSYGVPILVQGETGSGKEQIARRIHRSSGRDGAFVAINCAGLPAELIEAELFGHMPGAFTGARAEGGLGLVRRADGGTLFLDEIGDMPAALQAHLLRLLDTWQVRPVGSDTPEAVDIQLVCATHRDLNAAVAAGTFRADLLHRIRVARIDLPPLRARTDRGEIADALLARIDPARRLSPCAHAVLAAHDWPGNIRELRNIITQAVLADDAPVIDAAAVRSALGDAIHEGENAACAACVDTGPSVRHRLTDHEAAQAVAATQGNIAAAARALGVSRTTLYKHLES